MQLKPSRTPLAGRGRFGSGLHDTRRVPTDRPPDLPVGRTTGSRTSEHFCRRHICLSPRVGWPRFSRDGRPERSQPAFAARGCRRPPAEVSRQLLLGRPLVIEGSPSIRTITDRPSLPLSSLPHCLISLLRSRPSLVGRRRG